MPIVEGEVSLWQAVDQVAIALLEEVCQERSNLFGVTRADVVLFGWIGIQVVELKHESVGNLIKAGAEHREVDDLVAAYERSQLPAVDTDQGRVKRTPALAKLSILGV